ncbi:hypothetical protein QZH41_003961 [Actinostola sp. cb2023]|nr:hypothetical protein QZH41_003961 [Actinostola sp. cb2023]
MYKMAVVYNVIGFFIIVLLPTSLGKNPDDLRHHLQGDEKNPLTSNTRTMAKDPGRQILEPDGLRHHFQEKDMNPLVSSTGATEKDPGRQILNLDGLRHHFQEKDTNPLASSTGAMEKDPGRQILEPDGLRHHFQEKDMNPLASSTGTTTKDPGRQILNPDGLRHHFQEKDMNPLASSTGTTTKDPGRQILNPDGLRHHFQEKDMNNLASNTGATEKDPGRQIVNPDKVVSIDEIEKRGIQKPLGKPNSWGTWGNSKRIIRFKLEVKQDESNDTLNLLQDIFHFHFPFNLTIADATLVIIKATTRVLSYANLQMYYRNEYAVSKDAQSAVSIKKTGEVLQSRDYYTNGTSANESQVILVCRRHQIANCSGKWVLMKGGEYVVLENRSIFVNASRRLYDWSEYIWRIRSLYVCEHFSAVYHAKAPVSKDDQVLSILTLVCMLISIIALVFVLVTYSLFTELQTLPGINLMNLSISILLAQLLWILGSGQTDTPIACTIIAVLLHYLFLVSFVWTSIIAFDTWKAFTANGRRPSADSKHKRLVHWLRYMAVGWLSAMVYVAICVVLDLSNVVTIGYQSSQACWMANPWAILFSFAVPVTLILMFNIVMYVLTMKSIHVTTAQARVATDHKDRRLTFGIYVRIASAMGFTWTLGFIAPFGWYFLWYLYVILNGLQGVYIAVAFGLNQRGYLESVKDFFSPSWLVDFWKGKKVSEEDEFEDFVNEDEGDEPVQATQGYEGPSGRGMASQTAKRILETLEKMSSPLVDAKKIPPSPPFSTSTSPLSFTQTRRRKTPQLPYNKPIGSPRKLEQPFAFGSGSANPTPQVSIPQTVSEESMDADGNNNNSQPAGMYIIMMMSYM